MAFIQVCCPGCGGEIQLDDTRAFGFCLYCGAKIVNSELPADLDELFKKALIAYKDGNYLRAYKNFSTVTQFGPDNWKAVLLRDYSECLLSSYKDDPLPGEIENTKLFYTKQKAYRQHAFDVVKFDTEINEFVCSELGVLIFKFIDRWIKYLDPEPEFETLEVFSLYQRDLYNCVNGLEYCVTLLKENQNITVESKLFSVASKYSYILLCFNLLSKHHKITNGKWVSVDSEERKKLVAKWDEYKSIQKQIYDTNPFGIGVTQSPDKKYQIERIDVEGKDL